MHSTDDHDLFFLSIAFSNYFLVEVLTTFEAFDFRSLSLPPPWPRIAAHRCSAVHSQRPPQSSVNGAHCSWHSFFRQPRSASSTFEHIVAWQHVAGTQSESFRHSDGDPIATSNIKATRLNTRRATRTHLPIVLQGWMMSFPIL